MNLPPGPSRDRVTPLCRRTRCLCLRWMQAQTEPRPTSPALKWEKQGCSLRPGGWPSPTSGSLQVLGKAERRPRGRGQAGRRAQVPGAGLCCHLQPSTALGWALGELGGEDELREGFGLMGRGRRRGTQRGRGAVDASTACVRAVAAACMPTGQTQLMSFTLEGSQPRDQGWKGRNEAGALGLGAFRDSFPVLRWLQLPVSAPTHECHCWELLRCTAEVCCAPAR